MMRVRLILALHNHQPVGNFDGVFEESYRLGYLPFLEVLEDYPDVPVVLHTSGPLMEWLAERRPDYVARLRRLVEAGQVEVLGGGFYEPILTMIPERDRIGQIRAYSAYLEELLGARVRGMWVPERVWEQHLVSPIVRAGIEYTILDDFHFERAGLSGDDLFGYYLAEEEGSLLKIFPGSEALRYAIPFREPHASYEFLRDLARRRPGCTVVCADDGEKFGSWPETYDHVYTRGWLRRFFDMIRGNRDWLEPTTLAGAVDSSLPLGKVYLPDGSYREMTEWAMASDRFLAYRRAVERLGVHPDAEALRPFVRAGASWRNFKARYAESDEMYTRMLGVSKRLEALEGDPEADPDYLEVARQALYRGQCNCPYWHGSFGGLYLPHLRNAIYGALIQADNALDDAEGLAGPRASIASGDFNLDARQEVRLENEALIAFVRPAVGGHVYELDVRRQAVNVLATLDRRPEPYHGDIRAAAARSAAAENGDAGPAEAAVDRVRLKHRGLDRMLVYDHHPRKSLVDHFFEVDATLDDLLAGDRREQGDFVTGTYLAKLVRDRGTVALVMERPGLADGRDVRIRKTVAMAAGTAGLSVDYEIEGIPAGACLHFAVELNLAAMAGHADDRYYADPSGNRLGLLDARLDLPHSAGLGLTDEWLDLRVDLAWSRSGGLWCFPIQTVSQSEGGFERVYQSSAILPHWHVTGDEQGRWAVRIDWSFSPARGMLPEASFRDEVMTSV
jgi:alpha-amylase